VRTGPSRRAWSVGGKRCSKPEMASEG
jgi:hypothetical protein